MKKNMHRHVQQPRIKELSLVMEAPNITLSLCLSLGAIQPLHDQHQLQNV
jgi:hypothetical protein